MPRGRQLPLVLSDEQRAQVRALANSSSMPHALVQHARIIVAGAEGRTNAEVATRVGASPSMLDKWRRRFLERGVEGLHDELLPGRPRHYDDTFIQRHCTR